MIFKNSTLDYMIINVFDIFTNNIKTQFKQDFDIDIDVLGYVGAISDVFTSEFQDFIERIKEVYKEENNKTLAIVLSTLGGSATAVEQMVNTIRYHYEEVYFIIPDRAMSAGTIFSMSGDKIFMDYGSALGPIDPQVPNKEGVFIPALGYIDKIEELIEKSHKGTISEAEFLFFQKLDLGEIRKYEQARDLSISLLKEWLVKYKFKNWTEHRTNNPGQQVTKGEKEARAEEIAKTLSDNKRWHTHNRYININILRDELRLEIEDYTKKFKLRHYVLEYSRLLNDYIENQGRDVFFHANFHENLSMNK